MFLKLSVCFLVLFAAVAIPQQKDVFRAGSVIPEFGKIASVDSDVKLSADTELKICFDVAEKSGAKINRTFDSAARFINVNVDGGADPKKVSVAIVVHGTAAIDVSKNEFYGNENDGIENPNAAIIAALQKNRTTIYLCGQTAAWRGIGKEDLLPGVKLAPSAMTAHALLQHDGYALCPF
ncbi:DsrE family protein [Mariniblastus fucicola]|uniref:DsrE/DsrF-like family protein n=1 Tax=Mariniblastus fucicola TaxID=980251 RepID=A0A5B9PBR1_9BACT|nr:DsrE family protein [Mariniblastus fucicola]QEG22352.1 DsrE/DsrF-like family protein [Mariniblastus fucicola]